MREKLLNVWNEERVDSFLKEIAQSVKSYKVECLEKFLDKILLENGAISEEELIRYSKNMDAFVTSEEFLVDFFEGTKTEEGSIVAKRVMEDSDFAENILTNLISSGKIEIIENENEFIVWYR